MYNDNRKYVDVLSHADLECQGALLRLTDGGRTEPEIPAGI